jgi:hypothetical protein
MESVPAANKTQNRMLNIDFMIFGFERERERED